MHKWEAMAGTSSIYNNFIIGLSSVTLTFNLHEHMLQMALLLFKNNCAQLFWNPCINVVVMAWTSSKFHLTFKCDLDFQSYHTNVSNGTSTPQREQLCHIILKSKHKCRSYGPDKFNLWQSIIGPSSVTLTFNLKTCFKGLLFSSRTTSVPNYFEIHA